MYAPPRAAAGPDAVGWPGRVLLDDLDAELIARALSDTPVGRISGLGSLDSSREDIIGCSAGLIRDWMVNGRKPAGDALPELYEAARAAARHGLAAADAFRACCGAVRAVWGMLLESCLAGQRDSLMHRVDMMWAFLDVALQTITTAFADQRDLPSSDGNSRARALFARICAQSLPALEDIDRAERMGFPLAGQHSPFVAAIDAGSAAAHANLAARMRAAGALAYAEGHRVAGLTHPGFEWPAFLADAALILAIQPPTSQAELADAVSNLHDLVTLAGRAGRRGRIRPDDFLTEIMLVNSPQLAERIMQRVLGRLNAEDSSRTLSRTLRCLAAHGFDRAATAAALPAHRNTLHYRVSRIEKLTGLDLSRHAHREMARLAVIWMETTSPDPSLADGL